MYKRSRYIPQGHNNDAGQKHGSVYSQTQHWELPGRSAGGVDWPFSSKPVSHRSLRHPRIQDSLHMYEFEKMTISEQPKKQLLPQEYHLNGIKDFPESDHRRKDSYRASSEEIQMAREIHSKELLLCDKLWRVEEKIRLKIQRGSAGIDAGDDPKSEGENHNRRQPHTKIRLPDQCWREPVKSREMLMQERREEDVKRQRKKHSQWDDDRKMERHEQDNPTNVQKISGELDIFRWQNVKKYTREQGDEKHYQEEADVRLHDGTNKAKEREVKKKREKIFREITYRDMYNSDNKHDSPQISQHKAAPRLSTENHRDAESKMYEESTLPPVSSHSYSSRPQRSETGLVDGSDASFQLLLCRICNRKFASGRLQKHVKVCEKVNRSHRQVFNSYSNRTKGSAIEEFWKNHSRSKTPEVHH